MLCVLLCAFSFGRRPAANAFGIDRQDMARGTKPMSIIWLRTQNESKSEEKRTKNHKRFVFFFFSFHFFCLFAFVSLSLVYNESKDENDKCCE